MDPAFRIPSSPGTPLFPVSPERANRQQLHSSPTRQSDLSLLQNDLLKAYNPRNSSDVQGKVAQFNNLSKEASQRRKDHEAALKRAVIGREEAESETRRLKEESRQLRKDLEDGAARERRVGERMEAVKEEMQRLKDTQAHSQILYEKEVRRARKEAFKSSSALVKLQEELKNTRNKFTFVKEDNEIQRKKVENREQEAFAAKYELVGVQEELEELRHRMKIVKEERDALKTSLQEEEVARVAAEGKISLPVSIEQDEFSSPRKLRRESGKENIDPEVPVGEQEEDYAMLKEELRREKGWRIKAVELIDFMKVECQFGRCSCQLARKQGITYTHSYGHERSVSCVVGTGNDGGSEMPATPTQEVRNRDERVADQAEEPSDSEHLIEFSPTTGTFRTIASPAQRLSTRRSPEPAAVYRQYAGDVTTLAPPLNPIALSESPSLLSLGESIPDTAATPRDATSIPHHISPTQHPSSYDESPPPASVPNTPRNFLNRLPHRPQTVSRILSGTITTTIPLADPFSPAPPSNMPYSPASTMTREQALEQIRQRRGRARSIAAGNGTPRKAMMDLRRDISAPTVSSARKL